MSLKAYQDHIPPSNAYTAAQRQNDAAFSHGLVVEDIEDGYLNVADAWQNYRAVFYARARYNMGLREADYDL